MVFNAIKFNDVTFTFKGGKCTNKPCPQMPDNTNSYTIKLASTQNPATYISFKFWCPIAHPNLTEKELCLAFLYFVDDAVSGKMKFKEFVEEFGFTDPVEAWETWNSCKQARKKLSRIYNGDFYDLINFLNDEENDDWPHAVHH